MAGCLGSKLRYSETTIFNKQSFANGTACKIWKTTHKQTEEKQLKCDIQCCWNWYFIIVLKILSYPLKKNCTMWIYLWLRSLYVLFYTTISRTGDFHLSLFSFADVLTFLTSFNKQIYCFELLISVSHNTLILIRRSSSREHFET